jgi:hypothetical protein
MTNKEWINSLSVNDNCKERLAEMANIAASVGLLAIQFNLKIKELRKLTSFEIQDIFNKTQSE